MTGDPFWSNHEVSWESTTAFLNRFFECRSSALAYAKHLAKNPLILEVVVLEHDGPHGRTPSKKTVVKAKEVSSGRPQVRRGGGQ